MVRAVPPLTIALLLSAASWAGMRLELPEGEAPARWEPVVQEVGLELGEADEPPWARLHQLPGGGCELEVACTWGALQRERVPCPESAGEREELASLAVVMLELLVAGDRPLGEAPAIMSDPAARDHLVQEPTAAPGPPPQRSSAPPEPPLRFELLEGSRAAIDGRVETMDAARSEPGAGGPAALGESAQGSGPAPLARTVGTSQFNPLCYYTDCAVSFDRRSCGVRDGCSTAAKCPETYWLDFDRDGYGDPSTCLSLATERGLGAWVQNVGDCDDRHSSIHPGAEEVIGDDIDNDCDGVAR
jgi:hypothetical protein